MRLTKKQEKGINNNNKKINKTGIYINKKTCQEIRKKTRFAPES